MQEKVNLYTSDEIIVSYYPNRCNHIGNCVKGLPDVFNSDRKPWIEPEKGEPDAIAETIEKCPTGALQYERLNGAGGEKPDVNMTIQAIDGGPFFVRGNIELRDDNDRIIAKNTRVALCRCHQSENKPFCDGSHKKFKS